MLFHSRFSKLLPILVTLPAIILYGIFTFLPAVGNIVLSFTNYSGNVHLPIHWVGLLNYKKAFTEDFGDLGGAIKVTFLFSIMVTVIQNIVAVLLAILVNMKLKLRNFYRAAIFFPNLLGVVVVGLVWNLVLNPYSGPITIVFSLFHVNSAMLGDPKVALYIVVFVTIWMSAGYAMLIYLAGLQSIPEELYEAGRIDGASPKDSFLHITLPLIRPSITINMLLSIIGTLGTYDLIMVLTGGGPGTSTRTLGLYILDNLLSSSTSQGFAAALSIIHFTIILVIVLIAQYYLRRKEAEV